jgi:cbb3-type cytochrome oxidase subunit 3
MDMLTYDAVARFSMVASLLLFIAMFLGVLAYVFLVASRDKLEKAQRDALDLGHGNRTLGGRS